MIRCQCKSVWCHLDWVLRCRIRAICDRHDARFWR